ncbi:ras family GTPase [Achlya hypogyna]|uniref:Ras family GTPase n=1 Tax=Achlya hypogyna TaxID=1202772 RepID=A0A1V9YGT4_ACHHY|nr:ras family GTPase [Achlya hypogyna]
MDAMDCDDFEKTLKVIVLGNGNVGKTSLTTQYAKGRFTSNYKKTIGVDFMERTVTIDGDDVHLMIWDTAGQEEFDTLTSRYYKGAGAAVYVFSTVDRDSFEALPNWQQKVLDECGPLCQVLVQNKTDLMDQAAMTKDEVDCMKRELNLRLFRTSVQENINVDETFEYICRRYLKKATGDEPAAVADIATLTSESRPSSKKSIEVDQRKTKAKAKAKAEKAKAKLPMEEEDFDDILAPAPTTPVHTNPEPVEDEPVQEELVAIAPEEDTNTPKILNVSPMSDDPDDYRANNSTVLIPLSYIEVPDDVDAYVALARMRDAKATAKEARQMAWEDFFAKRWNDQARAAETKATANLTRQIEALSKHQAQSSNFELWNTALDQHYYEYVQYALRDGADIPKAMLLTNVSNEGVTPLVKACLSSDLPMIRLLLDAGADPSAKFPDHDNPFMRSIYRAALKNVHVFELLLAHAAPATLAAELSYVDTDGKSILHLAAEGGHVETLKVLINHPVTSGFINAATPLGQTPLHLAVLGSYTRCVRVLLQNMLPETIAAIDGNGNNALHLALKHESTFFHMDALVETFLTSYVNGCCPGDPPGLFAMTDANGCTVLHLATSQNLEKIALRLMQFGKTPLNLCNKEGRTVLHEAVGLQNHTLIRALIDCNVMIDVVDDLGQTPLLMASLVADTDTIKMLLGAGADPACQNREGHTSLHYLASYCRDEAPIRMLIKKGAGVNARSVKGNIPLHFAAMKGNEVAARILLEYGADMSILNEDKRTVVFLARQWGHVALEEYFNDLLKEDAPMPTPPISMEMASSIASKLLKRSKEAKAHVHIKQLAKSPKRSQKRRDNPALPLPPLSLEPETAKESEELAEAPTLDSVLETVVDTDWESRSISGDSTLSTPFEAPPPYKVCLTPFVRRQLETPQYKTKQLRHDVQELLRHNQPLQPLRQHVATKSILQSATAVHIPWNLTVPTDQLSLTRRNLVQFTTFEQRSPTHVLFTGKKVR